MTAVRRPLLYHVMSRGRGQVTAASELVPGPHGPAVELDPAVVGSPGVVVPIDPRRLVELDAQGWIYGCPELVDRRMHERRRPGSALRSRGRRAPQPVFAPP